MPSDAFQVPPVAPWSIRLCLLYRTGFGIIPFTRRLLTPRGPPGCNRSVGESLGMRLSTLRIIPMVLALAAFAQAGNEEWSGWRGPRRDGTSGESGFPVRWSATENVVWR